MDEGTRTRTRSHERYHGGPQHVDEMVEEAARALDAVEVSPARPDDPLDIRAVLEGVAGYSPKGTDVLRRRGIGGVFVFEDGRGRRRLLVCEPLEDPVPPRMGLAARIARLVSSRPVPEYLAPRVRWWPGYGVYGYYVAPNFREDVAFFADIVFAGLHQHYPAPPDAEERQDPDGYSHIGYAKGEVYLSDPIEAAKYAAELGRAMEEQGVLCEPVVGLRGLTDSPLSKRYGDAAEEKRLARLPTLEPDELTVFDVMRAYGWVLDRRHRCRVLKRRLADPAMPQERRRTLEALLAEQQQEHADAERRAGEVSAEDVAEVLVWLYDKAEREAGR